MRLVFRFNDAIAKSRENQAVTVRNTKLTMSFRQVDQATLYQHSYIRGIRVERLAGGPLPP
jgi:hypothetical protein